MITRRQLGLGTLAFQARAASVTTLKIGYQTTNLPVIAKSQGVVEEALKPLNIGVEWVEFNAGPPLV